MAPVGISLCVWCSPCLSGWLSLKNVDKVWTCHSVIFHLLPPPPRFLSTVSRTLAGRKPFPWGFEEVNRFPSLCFSFWLPCWNKLNLVFCFYFTLFWLWRHGFRCLSLRTWKYSPREAVRSLFSLTWWNTQCSFQMPEEGQCPYALRTERGGENKGSVMAQSTVVGEELNVLTFHERDTCSFIKQRPREKWVK